MCLRVVTAGHYRAPITSDIVEYRWERDGGREGGRVVRTPSARRKGWTGRANRKRDEVGGRSVFLVEGGNHCLQALGIHACRLRESPAAAHAHARVCVGECEFAVVIVRADVIIRGVGWNVIFGQRNMRCVHVGRTSISDY